MSYRFPVLPGMISVSVLANQPESWKIAETEMIQAYGPILERSAQIDFVFSKYYDQEMGQNIQRAYWVFSTYCHPADYYKEKLKCIAIEDRYRIKDSRIFNLDVGFIELDKFILLSTKPATYRIYLNEGVYAQSTYYFKDHSYHPWPWTYADYRIDIVLNFFTNMRNIYKSRRT